MSTPLDPPESNPDKESGTTKKIQSLIHQQIQAMGFSGPIPPPEMLQQYDRILAGAADRILSMAEKQSNHRQSMEKNIIASDSRNTLLGLIFAFVLVLVTISAGTLLIYMGKEGTGLTTIIAAIGSVIGIFIYRKRIEKKEHTKN